MIHGSMKGGDPGNSPLPMDARPLCEQSRMRGSGVIFAIIAIAVILAVAYFYMASEKREDVSAKAAISAAEKVDNAARNVGDITKKAAEKLRSGE
jgi:beta-lactam-binding protein with PASTA domain